MADLVMPSLGAAMEDGVLLAWRRAVGDRVEKGDIVAEVQTDKADLEIEVFHGGVIEALCVEPGTRVPCGAVLARIREGAAVTEAETARPSAPVAPDAEGSSGVPSVEASGFVRASPRARHLARSLGVALEALRGSGPDGAVLGPDVEAWQQARQASAAAPESSPPTTQSPQRRAPVRATPSARRAARERGLDLASIAGTGSLGAVTFDDVQHAASATAPVAAPSAAPAPPRPSPLAPAAPPPAAPEDRNARMRRAVGVAMARSKREIPHYYLTHTIDMGPAMAWLADENQRRPITERLVSGVLLVKAVALALRRFRDLNGFFPEDGPAVQADAIHVGVAISLRQGGLVAPAIHDTDKLSLSDLMARFQDVVRRARAGQLKGAELSDPTITVSSLGERGVDNLIPVINPPQVAIVGFGTVATRPWVVDGQVLARPVLGASLAADHRASDGHRGAAFLDAVRQLLQEPSKL